MPTHPATDPEIPRLLRRLEALIAEKRARERAADVPKTEFE
jgi:hypothetical protein